MIAVVLSEGSFLGALRGSPVGEDRSKGGRAMQEENGRGEEGRGSGRRRKNLAGDGGRGMGTRKEEDEEGKQNDGGRMMKMGNEGVCADPMPRLDARGESPYTKTVEGRAPNTDWPGNRGSLP